MSLKRNKTLLSCIECGVLFIFLIPLMVSKIFSNRGQPYPKKILIIELWGIGDLIMMGTILKPLKNNYPHAEISLLSKTYGDTLFRDAGQISKFIEFYFPWTHFKSKYKFWKWDWIAFARMIRKLRQEKFDLILDARGDIRNNLLSFLIGGRRRIGYDWTGGGYFLTDVLSRGYKNNHRIEAWMNILNYLHITKEDCHPHLFITERQSGFADNFFKEHHVSDRDLVVGIHPGAAIKNRCWPMERFAQVGEQIRARYNARVIVFIEPGGYGENFPMEGELVKARTSLEEFVVLIKKIDILLCNDSGAMHIATAVDTPVLALFGPGDVHRIGPYKNAKASVIRKDFTCCPCFDDCKYIRAMCLDAIETEEVMKAFDAMIRNKLKQKVYA